MSSHEDQFQHGGRKRTGWAELGNGETVKLAGPGLRFLARLFDILCMVTILTVVILINFWSRFVDELSSGSPDLSDLGRPGAALLLVLVLLMAYEVLPVAVWGRTLGKKIAGIKIVNAHSGEVPGLRRSFFRWVVPSAPTALDFVVETGLLGLLANLWWLVCYLSLFFDRVNQGWHDKAAGTLVIKPGPY